MSVIGRGECGLEERMRYVGRLCDWDQCGGFGRGVGDAVEFGIVLAEKFGDFHLLSGEETDEL